MRRLLALAALVALAVPAAAYGDEMPTRLWSEYPLVQKVERSSTPSLGPLLPPSDSATAPAPESAPNWGVWGAAMAACLLALLLVTRLVRPAVARSGREAPVQLRSHTQLLDETAGSTLAQYAPSTTVPPPAEAAKDAWRSVIRHTGLLRARYVVLEGQSLEDQRPIATSRGFWNVGGARLRNHFAEDAWDDLLNDLRAAGWEPRRYWRSDFYVLLQPVEPEPTVSFAPTLEAYGHHADDSD